MPKGGERTASAAYPVGRGMGFKRLYLILNLVQNYEYLDINNIQIELNKKYALWDDPRDGGRTETCRACIKELWRLGLFEKISIPKNASSGLTQWVSISLSGGKIIKAIPIGSDTWRGKANEAYRISEMGKYILGQKKGLFPYYVGWCMINACENGFFPQVENLFKLFEIEGNIPVNDDEVVRLTKDNEIYVDKHGSKAIKFGFLEPSGLIYRGDSDSFVVNTDLIQKLKTVNYTELFNDISENEIEVNKIKVNLVSNHLGRTVFTNRSTFKFEINLENQDKNSKTINIQPNLYGLFSNVSKLEYDEVIEISPNQNKKIEVSFISEVPMQLSDSLMVSHIGEINFLSGNESQKIFLPDIDILKDDHIWELDLIDMFNELGIMAFHLTGKSDRPDGVIDLSGLGSQPELLLQYLRNKRREKILMETTLGEYSGNKLKADTITENTRGMNKFQTHTTKVLKIAAIGQIIVADTFSNNIPDAYREVKNSVSHIVTLIDKKNLLNLIQKNKEARDTTKVINILKSNQIITQEIIDNEYS